MRILGLLKKFFFSDFGSNHHQHPKNVSKQIFVYLEKKSCNPFHLQDDIQQHKSTTDARSRRHNNKHSVKSNQQQL